MTRADRELDLTQLQGFIGFHSQRMSGTYVSL